MTDKQAKASAVKSSGSDLSSTAREDDPESDEKLIQQVLAGQDMAFQRLVVRYEGLVWQLMRRMIPIEADREEVAQDVFVKIYFSLKGFRFEARFTTWLYTIAYREALSYLRKRRFETEPMEELHHGAVELDESNQTIADFLSIEINGLSLDERTTITLFHYQGCSLEEIAAITGKPVGTLKNLLFRVRKKLKQKLVARFGPGLDKVLL